MRSRLTLLLVLLTAACSNAPAVDLTMPDYSSMGKINLDVKDLSFVDRGVDQHLQGPIISDQFQPTVAQTVQTWASQRLQAVGTTGQSVFVVKNAYVVSELLPTDDGWFQRSQGSKYVGHIEVEIDARGMEGYGLATANASRSVSMPENPTEEEKSIAYGALLNGMMQDLNANLENAIHDHLRDFVVTAPIIGGKLQAPPIPESPNQSP